MGYSPWGCTESDTTERLSTASPILTVNQGTKITFFSTFIVLPLRRPRFGKWTWHCTGYRGGLRAASRLTPASLCIPMGLWAKPTWLIASGKCSDANCRWWLCILKEIRHMMHSVASFLKPEDKYEQ